MSSPPPPLGSPDPESGPPPPPSPRPPRALVQAAEEEDEELQERPRPPRMPMKLLPYAVFRVSDELGSAGEAFVWAYLGIHVVLYVVKFLSLSCVPEQACVWVTATRVVLSLSCVANALLIAIFIRYFMDVDGNYTVYYEPPQQPGEAAATATVAELPPPPPQMDMC